MAVDWRSAYFLQAKSDYDVFNMLIKKELPLCHQLHYLQMMTEKLSKGFLTPPGRGPYRNTHKAFVDFVRFTRGQAAFQTVCNFPNRNQYHAYIDSLLPMANSIQELAPAGVENRPNPKYPWTQAGTVLAPQEYNFPTLSLDYSKMIKIIRFVNTCFNLI
jgi:hypothetical protein